MYKMSMHSVLQWRVMSESDTDTEEYEAGSDEEVLAAAGEAAGLQPYRFEPAARDEVPEAMEMEEPQQEQRLGNREWYDLNYLIASPKPVSLI